MTTAWRSPGRRSTICSTASSNGLHAEDLGPHRRVAVYAENSVETVLAHLGALLAGVSTVPVNFHLTPTRSRTSCATRGRPLLFVGPEHLERGLERTLALARVPLVVAWRDDADDPASGRAFVRGWIASAEPSPPPVDVVPRPNLMYTSGTTGLPKGVDLPPTMFAGGTNIAEHVAALQRNRFAQFGTHLVVGPMYHTGPLSGMRILAAGTPVVVLGRFDPERVLQADRRHRIEIDGDGADALHAAARAARRREGRDVRRQLDAARRPHRVPPARSTSSAG